MNRRKQVLCLLAIFALTSLFPLQAVSRDAPITTAGSKSSCPNSTVIIPITVTNFTQITGISLRLDFDPTYMAYLGYESVNAGISGGFTVNDMVVSSSLHKLIISWTDVTPLSLSNGDKLLDLKFTYISGAPTLSFNNTASGGGECEYADEIGDPMNDTPTGSFYFNSTITGSELPVSVSIAASANPVCVGTSVNFSATPSNGGATPSFQWKLNGTNVGGDSPYYSFIPANNDNITCMLTSSETGCISGNPATSNQIIMTVTNFVSPSITIAVNNNPICAGTLVTFTSAITNGGSNPVYQWKKNGVNVGSNSADYTDNTLVNNDVITCLLTSSESCANPPAVTSDQITMSVNPLLQVTVSIAASANPVCEGASVTFTASPINGGSTPSYQWKVNGTNIGGDNPVYSYVPTNNDVITCVLTSSETLCVTGNPATSNSITMAVNPNLPVSITISASANPVCNGTPITFTAAPSNGGTMPSFQWKVNGINAGASQITYSYVPANNDLINCVLTSNAGCTTGNQATSNTVTMTVSPLLAVSVTISASANPVCSGTSVTFTASSINGGSSPSYQWKVNGTNTGSNTVTYSYVPLNNDVITCLLTSSETGCITGSPATSTPVTMVVNPSVTSTTDIEICAYQLPYIWNSNSYATAGTYSVTLQSVLGCDSVATLNLIVNPAVIPTINILANSNPICSGTIVTFTATITNGGSNPVYQWKKNGIIVGTNASIYTDNALANNDIITCNLTSNATCAYPSIVTSDPITMKVNPLLTPTIAIMADQNPICIETLVTFTATVTNQGSNPLYQWKKNGVDVGTNSQVYTSNTLTNNDLINCVLTSNASCTTGSQATSNSVTMLVSPSVAANVTIAESQNNICTGTSVTFTAIPVGGGTPTYQWFKNTVAIATGATYACVPVNGDVIHVVMTSSLSCSTGSPATSNSVTMVVNPAVAVSVTIAASQNNICTGTSITFTATPVGGGTPTYQWFKNTIAVGTGATYACVPVNGDVVYVVMTSSLSCSTGSPATSNQITMVVNPIPAAPVITLSGNTLMSSATSGNQWYFEGGPISGATGQTHVATLSGWYWCNVTLNGCSSDTSNHVHVIITGIEELPGAIVRVYPSPTTGKFILELKGEAPVDKVLVDVYGMHGEKVLTEILYGERRHEFSLSDRPVGVYFIRVVTGDKSETVKIIKQ